MVEHTDPQNDGASPLPDWEIWACALAVERQHAGRCYAHVTERIETLARAGDWNGVATWRAIAERLDRLHDDSAKQ